MKIEEKAQRYDAALQKAKELIVTSAAYDKFTIEKIFPELKESEDEQSKKWILEYLYDGMRHSDENSKVNFNTAIAWLVKQNKSDKSLYIRFGDIPTNGKSKVYNGEIEIGIEEGISVYPAFEDKEGNIILGLNLPITKTSLHTQQHLLEYDNRPCYLVTGDYVGKGTDGEPLIKNVRIIKEIKPYRIKQDKENNTYIINNTPNCGIAVYNEELKDSADERIRKELIDYIKTGTYHKDWIAWLEKQVSIDENEVAKCVLNEVANSIMRWLDANLAEGNMCLSNMECEDIENAVRNANWQKVYGYMKKKLEKQGKQTQGKTALEAVKEEKVDNQNCVNLANKVEPSFKVGDKIKDCNYKGEPIYEIQGIDSECYICKYTGEKNLGDRSIMHFSLNNPYLMLVEQKPSDKEKPKFHKGGWIIHQGTENIYQVVAIIDNQYQLKYGDNYTVQKCADVDSCARLWDITKDAKDGDVLVASDGSIFLFAGVVDCACKYYVALATDNYIKINKEAKGGYWETSRAVHPATQEQRDTLFKAMADAGYEWIEETKELKKIESNSAWSEEDEANFQCVLYRINNNPLLEDVNVEIYKCWLQSLKQRIGG